MKISNVIFLIVLFSFSISFAQAFDVEFWENSLELNIEHKDYKSIKYVASKLVDYYAEVEDIENLERCYSNLKEAQLNLGLNEHDPNILAKMGKIYSDKESYMKAYELSIMGLELAIPRIDSLENLYKSDPSFKIAMKLSALYLSKVSFISTIGNCKINSEYLGDIQENSIQIMKLAVSKSVFYLKVADSLFNVPSNDYLDSLKQKEKELLGE